MGFFSTNEHSNLYRNYEFPVIEGYNGTIGCGLAIVEGYQNDLALFSAAVMCDLNEAAAIHEGAELQPIQEASVSGMLKSLVEFFKKLGAKIKAIFTAFMAKLESYFTKDLKGYVKKYERSLDRKDFKDMKVTIMPLKAGRDNYVVPEVYKPDKYAITLGLSPVKAASAEALKKQAEDATEDFDREHYIKETYNNIIDSSVDNHSDFDDWYHDQMFDTKETVDDWDYSKVKAVANRLTANTKTISNIKKLYDKIDGDIKKAIKQINDRDKELTKLYKDNPTGKVSRSVQTGFNVDIDRDSDNYTSSGKVASVVSSDRRNGSVELSVLTKQVNQARMNASAMQDVVLHISQVVMKEAKVAIAQDKKVFAAAVAYKATTTESTLIDMIAECAYDETIEDLDRLTA